MLRPIPLALTGVLLGAAGIAPPRRSTDSDPAPAAVDSVFARYDHTSTPGCALGVFRDGRIVYQRGYGMADLNQGMAITPRTVFYIASTSKQFTAMSIALLAEQGKLSLDSPVRKYVPELPPYADSITVRNLIHHTSGIRDYLNLWGLSGRSFGDEIPEEVALDLIARQRAPDFPAGARFSYSNSGYHLLALIVKRVSGLTLRDFAQANIFRPLGMSSTHFHDDRAMIVPRRAEGYEPDGQGGFRIVRTSFALVGDGGLLTTVEDLLLWDANFYQNRLGRGGPALIEQALTRGRLTRGDTLDYAFGLFHGKYRGLSTVEHGGSFIGFRAQLLRFPGEHFSVAVLCNDYTANPERLAQQVADRYLPTQMDSVPVAAPAPGPRVAVTPERLERLLGRYEFSPGMVAKFTRAGDTLRVAIGGQSPLVMAPLSDSLFVTDQLPGEVEFRALPDGRAGLLLRAFGMRDPVPPLPDPPVLTAKQRAGFVGAYVSEELDTTYRLEVAGDSLEVRARLGPWRPLEPIRGDEFTSAGGKLAFERDRQGKVVGFTLSTGRARNIAFVRVGGDARGTRD